ncbi:uncharacterized protein (DUF885 family) [Archangium gephyra]|uniref:Uncharacterized protein (DUF885 family) n=1 Tax=Archangium gephyra TaxID=48 RepID=A0AAC8TDX1_9BACT|nr:DUF885 domain-containing protein [Archangium gephyra]AKJ02262.1 Hypothetical protein AA314_03888 [Archangium gephyra]REG28808.1 uncharacterized protein (DUF885 family) [Archangium gephyra]
MHSRWIAGLALFITASAALAQQKTGDTGWVERSNAHAQVLLDTLARFNPEEASSLGVTTSDEQVLDLGPRVGERTRAAMAQAQAELEKRLAGEKDPNVRQDLQVLIQSAKDSIEGSTLNERYLLQWIDAPKVMFRGLQDLLEEDIAPERRARALVRLQRYAGLLPGSTPLTGLARDRFEEGLSQPRLLGPVKREVEQALSNAPTYVKGIRDLFTEYKLSGAEPALAALEKQISDYGTWQREVVLPRAREDFRLPPELYAFELKQFGIDIPPEQLMRRAQFEFLELRAQLQMLAPLVAKARGFQATGHLDVLRALKKEQLGRERIEGHYRKVIGEMERLISKHRVVDLPKRPMVMRLASEAESAVQPAPHLRTPQLVGNTGERGQFVLPLGGPKGGGGKGEAYDDFTFGAAAWSLSAHEGRPGHELQFAAMIERGVPLARSLFAFNSVNVEGWALYAEAEMVPYEPLDGQFIALQFRLVRAARAMLDPMLNLGQLSREEASRILTEEVGLSAPLARQEVDRYTFRAPGQAGSYFYGYTRLLELRAETELALGPKFDRLAFNNFILGQGLLPPDLVAKAVREEFVPARKAKAP